MIPNRYLGIGKLHLGLQLLLSVSLFWTVFVVLNHLVYKGEIAAPGLYFTCSVIWVTSLLLEYNTRKTKEKRLAGLNKDSLRGITYRQLVFTMATIFAFIVMTKDHSVSRLFLVCLLAGQSVWLWWSNLFGYKLLHQFLYQQTDNGLTPTLVVGDCAQIEDFLKDSSAPNLPGLDFRGYVTTDSSAQQPLYCDLQAMGSLKDIREICRGSDIKALLMLGLQGRSELVQPVVKLADDFGLRAMWVDNINKEFGKTFTPFHTENYSIVSHIDEPLENPVNRFWKRAFDILASTIGILLILPPAMILVWVLQFINAPGPLFYRQERTGRNGSKFLIYKFRSMYANGKDNAPTTKNDRRIFPGGCFIRKTSIDELPQLINVFLGSMSIVGPRPHADFTDEEHADQTHLYRLRSLVKPGITGLAQSKGFRGETTDLRQIKNRVRLDLFYIQKWRLSLDILIIALTILQVLKPPNSAM